MTFTVKALCERYSVTEGTVLTWIRSGELKAINVGKRFGAKKPRWRVTQEAISAFELRRATSPPVPRAPRRKRSQEIMDYIK